MYSDVKCEEKIRNYKEKNKCLKKEHFMSIITKLSKAKRCPKQERKKVLYKVIYRE